MKNLALTFILLCLFIMSGCNSFEASLYLNIPTGIEQRARDNGSPVYIGPISVGPPNSAGGRQITYTWKNISNSDIKYLTINTNLYNRVDDRVYCRIGFGGSLRFTGPVNSGSYRRGSPQSLCYDSTAIRGEVRSIRVVYMDDSSETIEREKLLEMGALRER